LKKKIEKLKTEKGVLINLMKKAQIERFRENNIPGLVYNIRIEKYREKLNYVNETIPILENKLRRKKIKNNDVKKVKKKVKHRHPNVKKHHKSHKVVKKRKRK